MTAMTKTETTMSKPLSTPPGAVGEIEAETGNVPPMDFHSEKEQMHIV